MRFNERKNFFNNEYPIGKVNKYLPKLIEIYCFEKFIKIKKKNIHSIFKEHNQYSTRIYKYIIKKCINFIMRSWTFIEITD